MTAFYEALADLARRGVLPQLFEFAFVVRGFLAVFLIAPLLGGLSHLVVVRRLAFFSTAVGQAALTGLALGILLGEPIQSPYGSVFGFCLLFAIFMVFVKRRSRLPPDTLIGVFLALTLGLGICLLVAVTKRFNVHQIEAVMFGSLLTVTDLDLALLAVAGIVLLVLIAKHYNRLVLDSLNPPLAKVAGADGAWLEYFFVVVLTAAIVVSLKVLGALLVEALVVVPAAAARNVARSTRGYVAGSILVALLAGLVGIAASARWLVPAGGAVVLALAGTFFGTLLVSLFRGGRPGLVGR